eukprot:TRINITY_DN7171_c0_g1_i1.p1 TRINITY_DN7171_c0_g1~~TRINITY_DN7171_c0_g1_i1.p1  ORF type:complete len:1376 (-),score=290.77 TRINITY_DN7171_c0_g1_i1:88-4215(-)
MSTAKWGALRGGILLSGAGQSSQSVMVFVRCRPFTPTEISGCVGDLQPALEIIAGNKEITVLNPAHDDRITQALQNKNTFGFDHCFWSIPESQVPSEATFSGQKDVFSTVGKPQIDSLFDGYNGCVFAYGQTGSGKTYTMMGTDADPGLIPQVCEEIFQRISKMDGSIRVHVEMSYMEIYNERIRDLLVVQDQRSPTKESDGLQLFQDADRGIIVKGLEHLPVKTWDEVSSLLEMGSKNRSTAATLMNEQSSRSHAVFQLQLTQEICVTKLGAKAIEHKRVSQINLVDLAGSERVNRSGVTGDGFKEAVSINSSLTALGRVIDALIKQQKNPATHVPYNDSKLTRILKEALGGNSRTVMLATASPAACNLEETINTLRYAERTRKIKNPIRRTGSKQDALIEQLKEELLRAKAEVSAADPAEVQALQTELSEAQELIEELTKKSEEDKRKAEDLEKELAQKEEKLRHEYEQELQRVQLEHDLEMEEQLVMCIRPQFLQEKEQQAEQLQQELALLKQTGATPEVLAAKQATITALEEKLQIYTSKVEQQEIVLRQMQEQLQQLSEERAMAESLVREKDELVQMLQAMDEAVRGQLESERQMHTEYVERTALLLQQKEEQLTAHLSKGEQSPSQAQKEMWSLLLKEKDDRIAALELQEQTSKLTLEIQHQEAQQHKELNARLLAEKDRLIASLTEQKQNAQSGETEQVMSLLLKEKDERIAQLHRMEGDTRAQLEAERKEKHDLLDKLAAQKAVVAQPACDHGPLATLLTERERTVEALQAEIGRLQADLQRVEIGQHSLDELRHERDALKAEVQILLLRPASPREPADITLHLKKIEDEHLHELERLRQDFASERERALWDAQQKDELISQLKAEISRLQDFDANGELHKATLELASQQVLLSDYQRRETEALAARDSARSEKEGLSAELVQLREKLAKLELNAKQSEERTRRGELLEALQKDFAQYREQFCGLLNEKEDCIKKLHERLASAEAELEKYHVLAEETAAKKIQARMRGMAARQEADELRKSQAKMETAATKIQSRFRGMAARKRVEDMRHTHSDQNSEATSAPADSEDVALLKHLLVEKTELLEVLQTVAAQQRDELEHERQAAQQLKDSAARLLLEKDTAIAELERALRPPVPLPLSVTRTSPPRLPPPPTPPPLPLPLASLGSSPERLNSLHLLEKDSHTPPTNLDPLSLLDERIARLKSEVSQVRHNRQQLLEIASSAGTERDGARREVAESVRQRNLSGDPLRPPQLRLDPEQPAAPAVVTFLPPRPLPPTSYSTAQAVYAPRETLSPRPAALTPSPLRDRPPPPPYATGPARTFNTAAYVPPTEAPPAPAAPRRSSPPRSRSPRHMMHNEQPAYTTARLRYE